VEADRLIDYSKAVRPTRNRLLAAMGIASGLAALLLALPAPLIDIASGIPQANLSLSVQIRNNETELTPPLLPPEALVEKEPLTSPPAIVPTNVPEPIVEPVPATDWRAVAGAAAKASVDDYIQNEEARASLWRGSHSVMFQPGEQIVLLDEEPLLADFQFVHRSRVIGLGLNIGSCFFGIPIAGVPVEQRSGAITIFVCGAGS
jgi:hypothetical protein